jgi:hypothetical protein
MQIFFLRFRDRAAGEGIKLPIIPGILPVQNWTATHAMARSCGTSIAPDLAEGFARAEREGRAEMMAIAQASELCDGLIQNGVEHLHFYHNEPRRSGQRHLHCFGKSTETKPAPRGLKRPLCHARLAQSRHKTPAQRELEMTEAKDFSDLPTRAQLLSMSGYEFMCAMRDGTLPRPPIARLLCYELTEVSDGSVAFSGTPEFDHTNPNGRASWRMVWGGIGQLHGLRGHDQSATRLHLHNAGI